MKTIELIRKVMLRASFEEISYQTSLGVSAERGERLRDIDSISPVE